LNAPADWPVLVTGAGGFIGGHVARALAADRYPVRGLTRRPPFIEPCDPPIDWRIGDLRDPATRASSVAGVRGVIHTASWVSLASDPSGQSRAINVDATRSLLADCLAARVERLVYTSTLHTLAAGAAAEPADEDATWNLECVDSPYCRTKREAERIIVDGLNGRLSTVALCPGMVLGPRDVRPTSTRILLAMSRHRLVFIPSGGIPIVDTSVIARAHASALHHGEPGRRYAVVGPYASYPELARLVAQVAGRPSFIGTVHDALERPLTWFAASVDRALRGRWIDVSSALIVGGFLRLHVRGDRADQVFGLVHPEPIHSIGAALVDACRRGTARGFETGERETRMVDGGG
jgi:dihydroflavonol-4-reductase